MTEKPFSQACENNQSPILQVIKPYFKNASKVLEIGSGTGQHAVYFAEHLPHLTWQTSDQRCNHPGILQWLADYPGDNLLPPLTLDVTEPWPVDTVTGVFSANTCHIMSWSMVVEFFAGVGLALKKKSYFCLYGPFNFNGKYTSDSNHQFDRYLKRQNPEMGLRNFEELDALAENATLNWIQRYPMPANNFILVWQKR